jgi:soluble P-type ATPase
LCGPDIDPLAGAFDAAAVVSPIWQISEAHIASLDKKWDQRARKLITGVKNRLRKLAKLVDIYVLTSDTRGTAKIELQSILNPIIIQGQKHDEEKRNYLRKHLNPKHVAVLGNGRNDKLWLKEVSKAKGLAIAVDVGEGCAIEALHLSQMAVLEWW